jgi:hypothetical protein
MSKLYIESEYDIQGDALRLLSLEPLLRNGMAMGPKTQETLERFRDYPPADETPMEWAYRVYKFRTPKLKVVK